MTRDPRIEPQPGDVLTGRGHFYRTVRAVRNGFVYFDTKKSRRQLVVSLALWQRDVATWVAVQPQEVNA